ncbi:MAG: ABC transporter permease [Microthrixaceae bacterium]|nr:ABC transporter permease [Microthrixaceae bacterium]
MDQAYEHRPDDVDAMAPSRLRVPDIVRVATTGMQARKARAALSVLGIAIGIASLVGVLGLSESSKSDLIDQLDALGTDLLTITPGQGFGAGDGSLPDTATQMIDRVPTVTEVATVADLPIDVYRNDLIPAEQTGALTVRATDPDLLATLNGGIAEGSFLGEAGSIYPTATLGSVAAERLGVSDLEDQPVVLVGEEWVQVVGVLEPFPLAPDLDRSVFIGHNAAVDHLLDGDDVAASSIYVRVDPQYLAATRDILPATADPENPEEVEVTRPSDVIEAQAAAESAFTSLFLGLGLVALVVGGIGIANVMVIGVIERRGEIGLRRAIGATRRHIRIQFLAESLLMGLVGGMVGVGLGCAATAAYAASQQWRVIIPPVAIGGGMLAALLIGGIAGLYPAMRASRLAPTEALRAD